MFSAAKPPIINQPSPSAFRISPMSRAAASLLLLLLLVAVSAPAAGKCLGKRCLRERERKAGDDTFTSLPGVQSCTKSSATALHQSLGVATEQGLQLGVFMVMYESWKRSRGEHAQCTVHVDHPDLRQFRSPLNLRQPRAVENEHSPRPIPGAGATLREKGVCRRGGRGAVRPLRTMPCAQHRRGGQTLGGQTQHRANHGMAPAPSTSTSQPGPGGTYRWFPSSAAAGVTD